MKSGIVHKLAVGSCLMATAGGVAYGSGCPAVMDAVWQAGVTAASTSVSAAIVTATETISAARVVNSQLVQSALRVLTKQIDTSSDKMAVAQLSSRQAASAFASEMADRKAVFQTTMEYSPLTGQGYDPCGELNRTKRLAVAIGEANSSMSTRVLREIDAAPGRVVADPGSVVAKRLSDARSTYCTADEAKAGVCSSPGSLAGKDRDAAHFFTSYPVGSPEAEAKNAMVNNMFGVPPAAPKPDVAQTPTGQSFYSSKRNYDTFRSIAQASFKAIQSWTESRPGGDGQDSVLDAISKKVATYAGGDNYQAWEQQLAAQSEHGLLVEYAKKRAFLLYISNLEYQQFERIEANVAALTALRARDAAVDRDPMKAQVGAKRVQ